MNHTKTVKELFHSLLFRKKVLEFKKALINISFTISNGESVGIIGNNGSGKSTLLKLIAGVSLPTHGTIDVAEKVTPLIELGAGFHPELTGIENVFLNGAILGLSEANVQEKLSEIIAFSEIGQYMDVPVKFYSSGMYMRLAFSVAIMTFPDILLLDEILSVGDENFQAKCLKKILEFKNRGVSIVFVSHWPSEMKLFCDRVIWLNNGEVEFDGEIDKGFKLYRKYSTDK